HNGVGDVSGLNSKAVSPTQTTTYTLTATNSQGTVSATTTVTVTAPASTKPCKPARLTAPAPTRPSRPAGRTATAVSSSQINLSWPASTDNVGVTGYRIYRGGTQVGTSASTSYSNSGLAASTAYSYAVG